MSADYGGWYGGKIHDAADTLTPGSYSDTIDLNVPAGTGYRIYVYYRAGTSGPWSDIFDDAAGRVDVAAVFSAIDVTAPATDVQKDQGELARRQLDDQRRRLERPVLDLGGERRLRRLVRGQDP